MQIKFSVAQTFYSSSLNISQCLSRLVPAGLSQNFTLSFNKQFVKPLQIKDPAL